jgi:hypothetical protein
MISTNKMIEDLNNVKDKIQKIPSGKDYKKYGSYDVQTISSRFGSWNNALMECFGGIIKEKAPDRPIIKCPVCGKETKNPKYCSRSCSAKINGSLYPKRPMRKCLRCQNPTQSKTHYCQKCLTLNKIEIYGEKTIKEFTSTYARHKYQNIRHHAHRIVKFYNIKKECPFCDYKNHAQLCHIKDIGKFDKNTKLKIVNALSNLIYLCPNHHWDLDHGYLKL